MHNENQLINYLHNNSSFYTRISNPNDIINRSTIRARNSIGIFISLIIGIGFSPIPFIDIPLFFSLLSIMMISIIKLFSFSLKKFPFSRYFNSIFENPRAGEIVEQNMNAIDGEGEINRISITNINNEGPENQNIQIFGRMYDNLLYLFSRGSHNISRLFQIFSKSLIVICSTRVIVLSINGATDFIPMIGWALGGVIASIINVPFAKKMGDKTIQFCEHLIRERGELDLIRNQIEGYRNAINFIHNLSLRLRWERKVLIVND